MQKRDILTKINVNLKSNLPAQARRSPVPPSESYDDVLLSALLNTLDTDSESTGPPADFGEVEELDSDMRSPSTLSADHEATPATDLKTKPRRRRVGRRSWIHVCCKPSMTFAIGRHCENKSTMTCETPRTCLSVTSTNSSSSVTSQLFDSKGFPASKPVWRLHASGMNPRESTLHADIAISCPCTPLSNL